MELDDSKMFIKGDGHQEKVQIYTTGVQIVHPNYKSSPAYRSAAFNLMNAIIGSGILGLPYAMANLGVVTFVIALISVTFLALFSLQNLLILCDKLHTSSYEDLMFKAFGKSGRYFVILMIYIHTLSAQSTYMTIVKELLPEVIMTVLRKMHICVDANTMWINGNSLTIVILLFVVVPLSSLRKIDFLSTTSSIAMACMGIFSVIIICFKFIITCPFLPGNDDDADFCHEAYQDASTSNAHNYDKFLDVVNDIHNRTVSEPDSTCQLSLFGSYGVDNLKVVSAIPTLLFAFMCHTSLFPIYNELHFALAGSKTGQSSNLRNQSQSRHTMIQVAKKVFTVVFIAYLLIAFFGYFTWYEATVTSDILIPYTYTHPSSSLIMFARICSLICVIFSTPLLHYPCRRCLTILLFKSDNNADSIDFSWSKHLGTMAINMTLVAFITLMMTGGISQIWAYSCPLSANSLLIVLPSLVYLQFFDDKGRIRKGNEGKLFSVVSDNEDSAGSSEESVVGEEGMTTKTRLIVCKFMVGLGAAILVFSYALQIYKDTH